MAAPVRAVSARIPSLDFLRACAILLVVAWHMPLASFPFHFRPATWAGVDLFFVLSGYLIGTQFLKPYTHERTTSYWDFFLKRVFRVMPAYLAILAMYYFVPSFREQPVLAPVWRFLTFTFNFGLDAGKTGAFSHAWSLCVEEHFYLLLPLIIYWLMRAPSLRKSLWLIAGLILGGMLLRAFLWLHYVAPLIASHNPRTGPLFLEYIYYPTYNRLDGLVVGVAVAALRLFRPVAWERVAARGNQVVLTGVAVLVAAFAIGQSMQSFATAVIGYPLFAVGFGLVLVGALSPSCVLAKPRFVGATVVAILSYSLYLTHKEIMHLDDLYLGGWIAQKGIVRISIYLVTFWIAAEILRRAVEKPGLQLRDRVTRG